MDFSRSLALLCLALGLHAATGCGDDAKDHDDETDEEAAGPLTGSVCDPTLTYAKDIQPLMTHYCISCHAKNVAVGKRYGAPTDHNFETEMGIAEEAVHADQESGSGPKATNMGMPPTDDFPALNLPVPTLAERVTMSKWFACQMK